PPLGPRRTSCTPDVTGPRAVTPLRPRAALPRRADRPPAVRARSVTGPPPLTGATRCVSVAPRAGQVAGRAGDLGVLLGHQAAEVAAAGPDRLPRGPLPDHRVLPAVEQLGVRGGGALPLPGVGDRLEELDDLGAAADVRQLGQLPEEGDGGGGRLLHDESVLADPFPQVLESGPGGLGVP